MVWRSKLVWPVLGFFLFFASYFTVRFIEPSLATVSAISITFFALPSFYFLQKENKKAWLIILIIGLFAYLIETIGILTGFPYSPFVYSDLIGPKWFGVTPVFLPLAFVPLVIGAGYFALKQKTVLKKYLVGIGILVLADLILDPAAVALGIWIWEWQGGFYGVPWVNFLGWILSGAISMWLFFQFQKQPLQKETTTSLLLILWFWTGATLWLSLWIPFMIGLVFSGVLTYELLKKE